MDNNLCEKLEYLKNKYNLNIQDNNYDINILIDKIYKYKTKDIVDELFIKIIINKEKYIDDILNKIIEQKLSYSIEFTNYLINSIKCLNKNIYNKNIHNKLNILIDLLIE